MTKRSVSTTFEPQARAVLAVDCSGQMLSLALGTIRDEKICDVSHHESSSQATHHESLVSAVLDLCRKSSIGIDAVREVVIGAGPGSFTGLRIGYSFVTGLLYGSSRACIAFPSHAAYAWSARKDQRQLIVVSSPCNKAERFVSYYLGDRMRLELLEPATIQTTSGMEERANVLAQRHGVLCLTLNSEVLEQSFFSSASALLEMSAQPGQLSFTVHRVLGHDAVALSSFAPLYVQSVHAKTIAERQSAGALPCSG